MTSGNDGFDEAFQGVGRQIGPFRLECLLGAGGMGQVFRAFDERLQRTVAVKRIRGDSVASPKARRRFQREARLVARLNHPNIVRVHDLFSEEDRDWLVMEFVEGENLAQILEGGALCPKQMLAIGIGVAEALAAAHAAQILHRDLKTHNVVLCPMGRPKILDFGLAKWTGGSAPATLTAEGQILGTPHAMSPEQAMGHKVDTRSDLFALGSLLYEMAIGEAPFRGCNPLDSLRRVCLDLPLPLYERNPGIPQALSDLVSRLLEKKPDDRPQRALQVVEALRRVQEGLGEATWDLERKENSQDTLADGTSQRTYTGVSERRQVTVLCCELFTRQESEDSLDSSKHYGTLMLFEGLIGKVAGEFGGHLDNSLGHGPWCASVTPRPTKTMLPGRCSALSGSSKKSPCCGAVHRRRTGCRFDWDSTPGQQ